MSDLKPGNNAVAPKDAFAYKLPGSETESRSKQRA